MKVKIPLVLSKKGFFIRKNDGTLIGAPNERFYVRAGKFDIIIEYRYTYAYSDPLFIDILIDTDQKIVIIEDINGDKDIVPLATFSMWLNGDEFNFIVNSL